MEKTSKILSVSAWGVSLTALAVSILWPEYRSALRQSQERIPTLSPPIQKVVVEDQTNIKDFYNRSNLVVEPAFFRVVEEGIFCGKAFQLLKFDGGDRVFVYGSKMVVLPPPSAASIP